MFSEIPRPSEDAMVGSDTQGGGGGAAKVRYRDSAWRITEFEIAGRDGVALCSCAALRMQGSLLLWLGAAGAPQLGAVALGVPPVAGAEALASAVAGGGAAEDAAAGALARRLARALARPVWVCCGATLDRLTLPLVERGLVAEIKSRPDCF